MNDFILLQSLTFLKAPDVIAACRANKQWNRILNTENGATNALWKQVCKNNSCVSSAMIENAKDLGISMNLLAKGLGSTMPTPTLDLANIFVTLELYREPKSGEHVTEALCLCRMTPDGIEVIMDSGKACFIRGKNTFAADKSVLESAANDAVGVIEKYGDCVELSDRALKVKVTLLRRDTNQAACIVDQYFKEELDVQKDYATASVYSYGYLPTDAVTASGYNHWQEAIKIKVGESKGQKRLQLAENEAGRDAKLYMNGFGGYTTLFPEVRITMSLDIPYHGSATEPAWLHKLRVKHRSRQTYTPNPEDLEEMSNILHVDFFLSGFDLNFSLLHDPKGSKKRIPFSGDKGLSMNMLLNGLCWE